MKISTNANGNKNTTFADSDGHTSAKITLTINGEKHEFSRRISSVADISLEVQTSE